MKNDGTDTVNLNGWKLRDKANHSVSLSGTVAAGSTKTVLLLNGQMPLNQDGDKITLLNPAGDTVDEVEYTEAQVSPGQPITFTP